MNTEIERKRDILVRRDFINFNHSIKNGQINIFKHLSFSYFFASSFSQNFDSFSLYEA